MLLASCFRSLRLLTLALLVAAAFAGAAPSQEPVKDAYGDPLPDGAVARLGTVRWRHDSVVAFTAFLPGNKSVITVSHDGAIRVWEFPSGKEIRHITASGKAVQSLNVADLSADGKTIATSFNLVVAEKNEDVPPGAAEPAPVAKRQEIHLHDVATGKELKTLEVETDAIRDLAFSPNGRHLMVRDAAGIVRVWDWANAKETAKFASPVVSSSNSSTFGGPPSGFGSFDLALRGRVITPKKDVLVYAPDGKTLLFYGTSHVPRFLEVSTGKDILPVPGHTESIVAVRFTPDGKHLLTNASDRSVHKWEAASSKDLGAVTLPVPLKGRLIISPNGHVGMDWRETTSSRGGRFGGPGGVPGGVPEQTVILFDLVNGKEMSKLAVTDARGSFAPAPPSPLFSPNGKMLAIRAPNESKIDLYDVATAKLLRTLDVPKDADPNARSFSRSSSSVSTLLFSPDSKMLAFQRSVAATTITLFDVETGTPIGSLPTNLQAEPPQVDPSGFAVQSRTVSPLQGAFSSDGRSLAVATGDTITLYELATRKPRQTYGKKALGAATTATVPRDSSLIALSSDGKLLARAGGPDGIVHLWDTATGRELAALKGHTASVNSVAFAPNGKTLASASADTTALIWDLTKIKRPAPPAKPQTADLDKWWQALAGEDATQAFAALGHLTASPNETVALIKRLVNPAAPLDLKRLEKLIAQLDDNDFQVREKATGELVKSSERLLPVLEKALAANPPAEVHRRLDDLRSQLTSPVPQGERLRHVRVVEILERISTPQAKQLLRDLSAWTPGAPLTMQARAALERLDK